MTDPIHQSAFAAVAPSAWEHTRLEGCRVTPLRKEIATEVAIIGGGATGLSTAHYLSKSGIECVVIEASHPGWGCSGRSGGLAVARYKKGFAAISDRYGVETTRLLYRVLMDGLQDLKSIAGTVRGGGGLRNCGHLTAAHTAKSLAGLQRDVDWLKREVGDTTPTIVDRQEVSVGLGTDVYVGGYLDKRSSTVHHLNFVSGFAEKLSQDGVSVYCGSPVLKLEEQADGVRLFTEQGSIRAKSVVVATSGYTSLAPAISDLERRIVPVASSLIATAPLNDDVAKKLVPAGWGVGDTRHLMNSFWLLPDKRFLYCGRGDITGRSNDIRVFSGLEKKMVETFPVLAGIPIDFRWSGLVDVTLDDFPHLGREGRFYYGLGYGGRGVVLSIVFGKHLADLIQGKPVNLGPMTSGKFSLIPFHRFRIPGMKFMAEYYRLKDRLGL